MKNIRVVAVVGVFMASIVLVTIFGMIPIMWGYLNLGDSLIMLSATILPASLMFSVGGIASGLADLLIGYPQYALFTLIIKGLEGYMVAILYRKLSASAQRVVPFLVGGLWIAIGYGLVDALLYSSVAVGWASLGYNALQGFVSAFIAISLCGLVTPKLRKLYENMVTHA